RPPTARTTARCRAGRRPGTWRWPWPGARGSPASASPTAAGSAPNGPTPCRGAWASSAPAACPEAEASCCVAASSGEASASASSATPSVAARRPLGVVVERLHQAELVLHLPHAVSGNVQQHLGLVLRRPFGGEPAQRPGVPLGVAHRALASPHPRARRRQQQFGFGLLVRLLGGGQALAGLRHQVGGALQLVVDVLEQHVRLSGGERRAGPGEDEAAAAGTGEFAAHDWPPASLAGRAYASTGALFALQASRTRFSNAGRTVGTSSTSPG